MKTTEIPTTLVLAFGLIVCLAESANAAPMGAASVYWGRRIDIKEQANGSYMSRGEDEQRPGYTIITTLDVRGDSNALDAFIEHKESLGFAVQVITDAHKGQTGDVAADNIRTWLQQNYARYNINTFYL